MQRWPDVHHSKIPTHQRMSRSEHTHRRRSSDDLIRKIPIQRQTAFIITISLIVMEAEAVVWSEMEIIIICSSTASTIATATFRYQIINITWTLPRTKWSSWWTIWIVQICHRHRSIIATCKSWVVAMDQVRKVYRKRHCWARWDVIDWMEVLMAKAAINYRLMKMPERAIRHFS